MWASADEIREAIVEVGRTLADLALIRDQNSIATIRTSSGVLRITWKSAAVINFSEFPDSSIQEYLQLLTGRHFNYLLNDGSLIQLSYDVKGKDKIIGSRAVWYPCPVVFVPEELEYSTLEDLVLTTPQVNLCCRGPLRFDYAPEQAKQDHPQTHMHAGLENFRLPLQRALEPSRFLRFVMRTAYPTLWRNNVDKFACEDWRAEDSLTDDDRRVGYLGWNPPIKLAASRSS